MQVQIHIYSTSNWFQLAQSPFQENKEQPSTEGELLEGFQGSKTVDLLPSGERRQLWGRAQSAQRELWRAAVLAVHENITEL